MQIIRAKHAGFCFGVKRAVDKTLQLAKEGKKLCTLGDLIHNTIFVEYLKEKGIGTIIHYPIPPHLSEAYAYLGFGVGDFPIAERYAGEVLSLPMYNGMTEEEQRYVIDAINQWEP